MDQLGTWVKRARNEKRTAGQKGRNHGLWPVDQEDNEKVYTPSGQVRGSVRWGRRPLWGEDTKRKRNQKNSMPGPDKPRFTRTMPGIYVGYQGKGMSPVMDCLGTGARGYS